MTTIEFKAALLAQLVERLETELAALAQSAEAARAAATHPDAKAENKYDTRGLEASYLAGAQAERLAEVQAQLRRLQAVAPRVFTEGERIALTALVDLELDGAPSTTCFVVPAGAGQALALDGVSVLAVTPQSPLGRALVGRSEGESAVVTTAQGAKEYEIVGVR